MTGGEKSSLPDAATGRLHQSGLSDRLVNTRTISVLRSSSFGRTTTQNTVLLRRMETYLRYST